MNAITPALLLAALISSVTPLLGLTPEHPCIPTGAARQLPTIDLKAQPAELKGAAIGKAKRSEDGRLHQMFKLTNVTKKPVYVFGHSKDSPFFTPATRNPDTGEWEEQFIGFCGTGARLHAIAPGESVSVTASIDQKFAAREIAIHLSLFDNPASEGHRQCRVTGLKAQL